LTATILSLQAAASSSHPATITLGERLNPVSDWLSPPRPSDERADDS